MAKQKKEVPKNPHHPAPNFASDDLEMVCTRCGAKDDLEFGECEIEGM